MSALGSVISAPLKNILPPVGSSRRFRQRKKVDLPDPEGPMTTTTSPFWIWVETPSRALIAPPLKYFCTLSARMITLSFTVSQPPLQLSYQEGEEHDQS